VSARDVACESRVGRSRSLSHIPRFVHHGTPPIMAEGRADAVGLGPTRIDNCGHGSR